MNYMCIGEVNVIFYPTYGKVRSRDVFKEYNLSKHYVGSPNINKLLVT
jgi:hypothetical protein